MSKKAYLNDPVPTITVTAEDIRDYQACSLYHHFKSTEAPVKYSVTDLNQERFYNSMKKVLSYFFYKRQGEATPSYNSLLKRWEKIWFPDNTDSYDLIHEQHSIKTKNLVTYSNVAASLLLRFFNEFAKSDKGVPISIDQTFLMPLIDGVRLAGSIDLVLKYGTNSYRVLKWEVAVSKKPRIYYKYDFVALRLGYSHISNRSDHSETIYELYGIGSDHNFGATKYQTSKRDIDWLFYWANKMRDGEIRIPSRGFTTYCPGCPWDKKCEMWNG